MKRLLWFKDSVEGWVQRELHAIDANHALEVDPENWRETHPEADAGAAANAEPSASQDGNPNAEAKE